MARQIALLRGINLGARNRVPMPALRDLLAELGYEDVATEAQSGNVVLRSTATAAQLERDLQSHVAEAFGVDTPVIVRTRTQLAKVVADNPLPEAEADPKRLQVVFLSGPVTAPIALAVEAADLAPEQVAVRGREIYAWHADGVQKSPLARLLTDSKLGVTATARNWNTVTKLLGLA